MNRITGIIVLCVVILIVASGIFYLNRAKPLPGQPTKSTSQKNADADAQKAQVLEKELAATTIFMPAVNKSGEVGITTLKETNGKLEVTIQMTGGFPKDTPQPAHIHVGTCPGVGEIKYPLTSLVNGKSVTTLNVSLAEIQKQLPLAINVHKSQADMQSYVSCGEFGKNAYTSSSSQP